ncbi:MAG TPA: PqqD family protein [Thermoanaerobaculia bacterium]|nr:PqqD family protein [Thermoanaerobaculia bacterium]
MITLATTLALDPRVRFRRFEDEGIVINQKTAEALVISEVGTRLLEIADGTRTLDECAALLTEEFDADRDTIAADVLQFANELVDAGVAAAR